MISVDGHPVRGAFTFAVGPNPGPAPQFVDPVDLARPRRRRGWSRRAGSSFLAVMAAIGLFVLRIADRAAGRPARVRGRGCARSRSRSWSRSALALVAHPGLPRCSRPRSSRCARSFDVGALVPLVRVSAFGRGYLDLELVPRAVRARGRASRSGSTGPSASSARSPSCSRSPARCSRPRAALLLVPGAGGPRRPDVAARRRARARLAAPRRRLGLGRRPDRPARALARACPPRAASPASSSACRASRTSRSSRCSSLIGVGHRRVGPAPADARVAVGDRRTGKALLVKIALLGVRAAARRRQPAAHHAAAAGRARAARARRRRGRAAAAARRRREVLSSPARSSPPRVLTSLAAARRRRSPRSASASASVGPGPGHADRRARTATGSSSASRRTGLPSRTRSACGSPRTASR